MRSVAIFWIVIPVLVFFGGCNNVSDEYEDDITGTWFTQGKRSAIRIYAEEGNYVGEIVELKRPLNSDGEPKRDFRNPDPAKKSNRLIGTKVLHDLEYDGDKTWNEGYYYDYKSGEKMPVVVTLNEEGHLQVEVEGEEPMLWRSEYPVGQQRQR